MEDTIYPLLGLGGLAFSAGDIGPWGATEVEMAPGSLKTGAGQTQGAQGALSTTWLVRCCPGRAQLRADS